MENPVSQIELAAWTVVSERIDADAVARVKENAKRLASESSVAFADEEDKTVEPRMVQRKADSSRFSSWLIRGGVAAAIAGAVLLAFLQPGDNSAAFAAALKKLHQVKVFSFDRFIHSENLPEPALAHVTFCEDGRQRSEVEGVVTLKDSTGIPRITLATEVKSAILHDADAFKKAAGIDDAVGGATAFDELAWYRELQGVEGETTVDLGKKEIDGISAFGKEIHIDKYRLNVWVNAETEEVVMVEHFFPDDNPIEKMVVKNFNFNEDADEKLFSFDVPEGYTVHTVSNELVELIKTPEKHAIELMRIHAELADGKLPISLSNWQDWFPVLVVEPADGGEGKVNTEVAGKLGGFTPFLSSMKKENYGYLGDGVFLNQDEKVIVFWYKSKEGQLRAIYSDMTVGDIKKSEIPAAKEPSPKQPAPPLPPTEQIIPQPPVPSMR